MDDARNAPAKLKSGPPILFLYGAKDQVIPPEPTKAVIAALGDKAEVHEYQYGYHMLLRDLSRVIPLRDIDSWIAQSQKSHPSE
jgi:alpha-beta hydrolase superfamily lysophospholipase